MVTGYETAYNWTVIDLLEPERTYIFAAFDYGTSVQHYTAPIYVHAAPVPSKRGIWVARQY